MLIHQLSNPRVSEKSGTRSSEVWSMINYITLKKYKGHPNLAPGMLAIGLANSVIIDSQLCPHSICG